MGMLSIPVLSPTACLVKSQSQCELMAVADSQFQQIQAVIPVWGYGTYKTTWWPSPGSAVSGAGLSGGTDWVMNQVWPKVYNQQAESWTQLGNTQVITTSYQQFCDQQKTAVTTGAGPIDDSGGYTFVSCTSTLLTLAFKDTQTPPNVGTYTSLLSGDMFGGAGPFDPNGTNGWGAITALCNTLLASLTLPGIPHTNTNQTLVIYPTQASPGYAVFNSTTDTGICGFTPGDNPPAGSIWYNMVMGCGNGIPVAIYDSIPFCIPCGCKPVGPAIDDYPSGYGLYTGTGSNDEQNWGACLCSAGRWLLAGKSTIVTWSGGSFVSTDHRTVYRQPVVIDPVTGLITMGVVSPGMNVNASAFKANGVTYSNPLTQFKTPALFLTSDFAANAGAGSPYGMIGFRSTGW